jgi:hypothetical protein
MRFVPIKNVEQQAILSLHRARQGLSRRARPKQIRSAACWQSLESSFRRAYATWRSNCP